MAVDVGKASGTLTLDGSQFLSELSKANEAIKEFSSLYQNLQTTLSTGITINPEQTIQQLGINPETLRQIIGQNGELNNLLNPNPEPVNNTRTAFQKLSSVLTGTFSTAVKGTATLVKSTFDLFVKFSKKTLDLTKQAVEVGMSFDASMSKVMSIVGDVSDEALEGMEQAASDMGLAYTEGADNAATAMDILRSKALEMGAQTRFTASQAADALSYMAMAGWKGEQMLSGLGGIMSLAAASGEDLAKTSDIVTDALTAFRLSAEDSQHFADVLAAASSNSNTNVGLMGETFKYVASMAGTMKYSIEDTAVAIGLMANIGIKGSQAGTALRNIISNLASPNKSAAEAISRLGISMIDSEGKTKSLMQTMRDLREAFKNININTDVLERLAQLEDSFQSGELSAEEYEAAVKDVEGSLSSLELEQAGIAKDLSGKYGLSGLLGIVNATEEDFNKLTEAIYNAEGAAGSMEGVQMGNLKGSLDILKSTYESLQISVSDLLKSGVTEFAQSITGMIGNLVKAIKEDGFAGLFREVGRIIPEIVNLILPKIPEILDALLEGFWSLIDGIVDSLPDAVPKLVEAAIQLFLGLVTGLTDVAEKLLPMLPQIVKDICNILVDNIDKIIVAAIDLFLALVTGLADALPEILGAVMELIPKIVKALLSNLNLIIDAAIKIILALANALLSEEGIHALIGACKDITNAIIEAFGEIDWLETANLIFTGLGDGLMAVFQGALNVIDEIFGTNLSDWGKEFQAFIDDLKRKSFEFGKSLADSMHKEEIELNNLSEQYTTTYQSMMDLYKKYLAAGMNMQDAMGKAYQEAFTTAEAQYVFRERYAKTLANNFEGFSGMTNQQVVDTLSKSIVNNNTYNFYTNEPIDEKKAAQEMEQTQKDLVRGM